MWSSGRGNRGGACHETGRAVGGDGLCGGDRDAHGQGRRARRPDGDCPRRQDRLDRSDGQGADSGGRHPYRWQRQVPDAGPGGNACPHSRRPGTRLSGRAHAVSLCRERHHDDPRHARRSAPPDLPRARGAWRDRQPAHLHIRPVVQRQDGIDERDGGRGRHRAEEGGLRPAEDSPWRAAGCLRRAGSQGRRAEDPLCRPCAGSGRPHPGARGEVREHRPPRRLCRGRSPTTRLRRRHSSAPT